MASSVENEKARASVATNKTESFSAPHSVPLVEVEVDATGFDSSTHEASSHHFFDRNEFQEIKKLFQGHTTCIRVWRVLVALGLALTGAAVCIATFFILVKQEKNNFEDAYYQFSKTVSVAAADSYVEALEAVRTFAMEVSYEAACRNVSWPFYDPLLATPFAQNQVDSKSLEAMALLTRVRDTDRQAYAQDFQAGIVEQWVTAGHIAAWGNLDILDQDVEYSGDITAVTETGIGSAPPRQEYWPMSFRYPPPNSFSGVNLDISAFNYEDLFFAMVQLQNQTLVSNVSPYIPADDADRRWHSQFHSQLPDSQTSHPHSFIFHPLHANATDTTSEIVASVALWYFWDAGLRNLLPPSLSGIVVVIRNTCGQEFTYFIDGTDAFYLGEGDQHVSKYDDYEVVVELNFHTHARFFDYPGHCGCSLSIFPSNTFRNHYTSNTPVYFVVVVGITFLLMVTVFFIYDWSVQRRNHNLSQRAAESSEIVNSMFPGQLQKRVMDHRKASSRSLLSTRFKRDEVAALLDGNVPVTSKVAWDTDPLVEHYNNTTVMFADLVGFTSWSSQREPTHVFRLLETCYRSFDEIARQRQVFKVETVGDCYVAVTGFPHPQKQHAVRMCRFAKDILTVFERLIRELELSLGPDTSNLALRVGIHSGPVIGGVIRGDRARFQLFGDTMNTTARIETNGEGGRMHISSETAQLLIAANKNAWLERRVDLIPAKGKGYLQTYWCSPRSSAAAAQMTRNISTSMEIRPETSLDGPNNATNFVEWNVATLATLLRGIMALRKARGIASETFDENETVKGSDTCSYLDEMEEIIDFPTYSVAFDPESFELDPKLLEELRYLVTCLANLHRPNEFHNFERASYVVQSLLNIMDNIRAPSPLTQTGVANTRSNEQEPNTDGQNVELATDVVHSMFEMMDKLVAPGEQGGSRRDIRTPENTNTFGVTADPLTHFACALGALFHDVDHPGTSDHQMAQDFPTLAQRFKFKLVAQQNALDVAWKLLMSPELANLRKAIYATPAEMKRFRALLVYATLVTDTLEKDILIARTRRWKKAFGLTKSISAGVPAETIRNRRATVVLENILILCKMAPSINSWHIYVRWNKLMFREFYMAWKTGHAHLNPVLFWEKGGLEFFDTNVVPAAQRLADSGVLGLAGASYLEAAKKNYKAWADKGGSIVAQFVEEINQRDREDNQAEDDDDEVIGPETGREWLEQGEAVVASLVGRVIT